MGDRLTLFYYELRRQFCLWRKGYRRPPFLLRREPAGKGHFRLTLWPDQLRWSNLWLAFLLAAPLVFPLLFTFDLASAIPALVMALAIFLLQVWILPCLVYRATPLVIFDDIEFHFQGRYFKDWFSSIPSIDNATALPSMDKNFCAKKISWTDTLTLFVSDIFACFIWLGKYVGHVVSEWKDYLPPLGLDKEPVAWALGGSPQESFLRLSLIEAFSDHNNNNKKNDQIPNTFATWLFYWLAPILSGYLVLWLALIAVAFDVGPEWLAKSLVFSAILWLVYSLIYVVKQSFNTGWWLKLRKYDDDFFPPSVLEHSQYAISRLPSFLSSANLVTIINLSSAAISGLYLQSLSIVKPTAFSLSFSF